MKKFATLILISFLSMKVFAQTPTVYIQWFPNPHNDTAIYQANDAIVQGLSFVFQTVEDFNRANFYVIENFSIGYLGKLRKTPTFETLKRLNCKYKRITEDFESKPGDLVYTIKQTDVTFYYHL